MKKFKLITIALFIIILIVMLPVCFAETTATGTSGANAAGSGTTTASSSCGEAGASSTSGEDVTAIRCAQQANQSLQAIAEVDSGGFLPKIPAWVGITIMLLSFVAMPLHFLNWVSLGSQLGINFFLSDIIYLTVGGYLANRGFQDFKNKDRTTVFAAQCNTTITITKRSGGGDKDSSCTFMDTSNPNDRGVPVQDGEKIKLESGKTYVLIAYVELEDWGTKANCKCTATGKIASHGSTDRDSVPTTTLNTPVSTTGSSVLVCCKTADGVCLDNYIESACTSAGGTVYCSSCSEVAACATAAVEAADSASDPAAITIGQGTMQITGSDGALSSFIKEGQNVLLTYNLPDATNNTKVIAHVKVDGTEVTTLELFDDGAHRDGTRGDKTYANTLSTSGLLNGRDSGRLSFDIEVLVYKDSCSLSDTSSDCIASRNIFSDQGSLTIIRSSLDCDPLGPYLSNSTLDIIFAANHYGDTTTFTQDASSVAAIIALTESFSSYYSNPEQGINFYTVKNLFAEDDVQQIKSHVYRNCVYSSAIRKLAIVLDKDLVECSQEGYTVHLQNLFVFNETKTAEASIGQIISDFCSYIEQIEFMNAPVPEILTQSQTAVPGLTTIEFKIYDEEYPVDYDFLFNYITLIKSKVYNNTVHQHVLNLPNGNWIFQIKATDKRGNIGYSNIINISTNDTMTVDFSSIGTITIPAGSSATIDLNSYVDDPRNEPIIEWVHEPGFSECVEFDPIAQIIDGTVEIIASGEPGCEETFEFTAITESDRRGSGTISVRVE